jgi:hypothetical protein
MNGDLYFVPVNDPTTMGPILQEFEGYVSDWVEPVKGVEPNFAYAALTSKYKRFMFDDFLHIFKSSFSNSDWKKWGEISKGKANFIEALAEWYGMELQKDTTDDLPF